MTWDTAGIVFGQATGIMRVSANGAEVLGLSSPSDSSKHDFGCRLHLPSPPRTHFSACQVLY